MRNVLWHATHHGMPGRFDTHCLCLFLRIYMNPCDLVRRLPLTHFGRSQRSRTPLSVVNCNLQLRFQPPNGVCHSFLSHSAIFDIAHYLQHTYDSSLYIVVGNRSCCWTCVLKSLMDSMQHTSAYRCKSDVHTSTAMLVQSFCPARCSHGQSALRRRHVPDLQAL